MTTMTTQYDDAKTSRLSLATDLRRQTRRRGRPEKECTQMYMTEQDDDDNAV